MEENTEEKHFPECGCPDCGGHLDKHEIDKFMFPCADTATSKRRMGGILLDRDDKNRADGTIRLLICVGEGNLVDTTLFMDTLPHLSTFFKREGYSDDTEGLAQTE